MNTQIDTDFSKEIQGLYLIRRGGTAKISIIILSVFICVHLWFITEFRSYVSGD